MGMLRQRLSSSGGVYQTQSALQTLACQGLAKLQFRGRVPILSVFLLDICGSSVKGMRCFSFQLSPFSYLYSHSCWCLSYFPHSKFFHGIFTEIFPFHFLNIKKQPKLEVSAVLKTLLLQADSRSGSKHYRGKKTSQVVLSLIRSPHPPPQPAWTGSGVFKPLHRRRR